MKVITSDGSHTLFVPALNEHYHSVNGAINESLHVFINAGLKFSKPTNLNILEIGFGTGLNALLSFVETGFSGKNIFYHCYEPFPLSKDVYETLNYPELIKHPQALEVFIKLHASEWDTVIEINDNFHFQKFNDKIESAILPDNNYHLVYFDAFAPKIQPELWTEPIFSKIHKAMRAGGVLVTYSAMGMVRRNMINAGFTVERLSGAAGKREMLRALK